MFKADKKDEGVRATMERKLEGKVAVITGAAGALGTAIAEQLLAEGAKVALVDFNQQALDKLVHRFNDVANVMGLVANVSREEDVKNYVERVVERWGSIDVFMNNAGIIGKTAPSPNKRARILTQ